MSGLYVPGRCALQNKVRYLSHHAAKVASRLQGGHNTDYHCAVCGKYHLTSQTKAVRKAIRMLMA